MNDNVFPLRQGSEAILALIRISSLGGSKERPFTGQPWTFAGQRGERNLPPMRYRDLGDIIVRAWEKYVENISHLNDVDANALAQNILRKLELEFQDSFVKDPND